MREAAFALFGAAAAVAVCLVLYVSLGDDVKRYDVRCPDHAAVLLVHDQAGTRLFCEVVPE